jgi:hypothetical protein
MLNTLKKIALAATLVSAFSLTACLQDEKGQESATTNFRIRASVPSMTTSGSLGKGQTIAYSKLAITLISNSATPTSADTVRDTIRAGVSQGFTSNSSSNQTIDSNYTLRALRSWTVRVSVIDTRGTVTHDTTISPTVGAFTRIGDTVAVTIGTLNPKFTQYRAVFSGVPDSITTGAGVTTHKQAIRISRLIMRIDGAVVKDSLKADYFNGLPQDTIEYDYVALGNRTVRLAAYGVILNAAGAIVKTDTLFVGTTSITSLPGIDNDQTISLGWTNIAGNNGNEKVTVTIGRVGRTTVTGNTSGVGVVPKSKN